MTDPRKAKIFKSNIKITDVCSFAGSLEKEGPCGKGFDGFVGDELCGEETWEKLESGMIEQTVSSLIKKSHLSERDIDVIFGGDLMNQCTSSAYGLEGFDIPYIGLYGACSTFAEGLLCAGMFLEAGGAKRVIACASSHFCTAERQYRFPLSYGAFPQGTSQHTVTGCGAVLMEECEKREKGIFLKSALAGIVMNTGITNASNMGAAMACAAADTIMRHLQSTGRGLSDFDMIATGDLGQIGLEMAKDIMKEHGYADEAGVVCDCGTIIYDLEKQNVCCGGSGCGCSAAVFCTHIFDMLKEQKIKNVLVVGTGAMMSPLALLQGQSIPSVAHLVEFEALT